MINEIFVDGTSNYPDWIELYNKGSEPVFLKGYSLSKNLEKIQWTISSDFVLHPDEYKVFYCDRKNKYDHTSFRLNSISGEIGLFSPTGELVDSVLYNNLPRFCSLERWPDGGNDFFVHASPTKGSTNKRGRIIGQQKAVGIIQFSHVAGRYETPFSLHITVPEGMTAHYTVDATSPNAGSTQFTAPISINDTTIVRVAAVAGDGRILSKEIRSYIFDEKNRLPVVSVVTDPQHLWDSEIGIYTEGNSLKYGAEHSQNWRNNWRRPVYTELFFPDQTLAVAGKVRIFGGASRGRPQKSLAVYATSKREHYGIEYQLFPDVERTQYAGFVLRNGGDAWMRSQIRDAFLQALVKERIACDTVAYRPVVGYLNGTYWGVYGLREFMMRKNLLARHKLPVQRIELMDGGWEVASEKGPFAEMPPVPEEGSYRPALAHMDIDAFLDYLAIELYVGNPDWPDGNIKCWRPASGAMKWRWVLFDLDRAFNGKRGKKAEADPFALLYKRPGRRSLMFVELAENKEFVRDFCARMVVHMLTTFAPQRALPVLDGMADAIRPEMQRHIDRWRWDWKAERLLMTVDNWEHHLDTIREYCQKRPTAMLAILDKRFAVGSPAHTTVHIATDGKGSVFAENVPLNDGKLQGPVPGALDISITVTPAPGYTFAGWQHSPEKSPQLRVRAGETVMDRALFTPVNN